MAEQISGTQEAFVERMNEKAQELKLSNTHFTNASGLHDPQHYSCASDMARIASALLQEGGEELLAIAKLQAGGKGYTLDERCDANLLAYFNAVHLTRARDAGNGRLARNKVEEAILNQSRRLVAQPEADLCLLLPEDFQLDDVGGV